MQRALKDLLQWDCKNLAYMLLLMLGTGKEPMVNRIGAFAKVSGDPTQTERFKNPPTNSKGNYSPSMLSLGTDSELQEWMVKDFNMAAWHFVKG